MYKGEHAEASVISEEAYLREVTRRLCAVLDPERIYLFGSRARGDHKPDSDYDFMIILDDGAPMEPHPTRLGYEALKGLGFHQDLKALRHSDFYEETHLKASLPSAVLRDGRLLYEREADCEVNSLPLSSLVCENTEPGTDRVLIRNTRDWLETSKADLIGAECLYEQSSLLLELVMFHCQQSVEKAMKAFLTWNDCIHPKTHDLNELGSLCEQFDSEFEKLKKEVAWLSEWSVRGRYRRGLLLPTRMEAELALQSARTFWAAIKSKLPASTWPLEP